MVAGAFVEAELVGMAGFFREKHLKARHKGRIRGVYVRADYRGRGIGRALLVAGLERVKAIPGLEQVILSVTSSQAAARDLYRPLGVSGDRRPPPELPPPPPPPPPPPCEPPPELPPPELPPPLCEPPPELPLPPPAEPRAAPPEELLPPDDPPPATAPPLRAPVSEPHPDPGAE